MLKSINVIIFDSRLEIPTKDYHLARFGSDFIFQGEDSRIIIDSVINIPETYWDWMKNSTIDEKEMCGVKVAHLKPTKSSENKNATTIYDSKNALVMVGHTKKLESDLIESICQKTYAGQCDTYSSVNAFNRQNLCDD